MEMQDQEPSCVGAQDMDTSGHQVSDLEDIEFHWEDLYLNMDAVFRPDKDTHVYSSIFNILEMPSVSANPILIDKKQDKENSPPLPTTAVSGRPI